MKKISFWCIICILISTVILANQTVEELGKKLQKVSGKEKIKILNKLAFDYQFKSVEKMLTYGKQALILSRSLKDLAGEAEALYNICIGYHRSGNFEKALKNVERYGAR